MKYLQKIEQSFRWKASTEKFFLQHQQFWLSVIDKMVELADKYFTALAFMNLLALSK